MIFAYVSRIATGGTVRDAICNKLMQCYSYMYECTCMHTCTHTCYVLHVHVHVRVTNTNH